MAARTAWVGGVVTAAMGIVAPVQFAEWEDWVALIVGVLMIIAPWAMGFAAMYAAAWTLALGVIVAVASVSEVWMVHHPAATARGLRRRRLCEGGGSRLLHAMSLSAFPTNL